MKLKKIFKKGSFAASILIFFFIAGCKDKSTNPVISTNMDDAADVVAAALGDGNSTSGVASGISDAIDVSKGNTLSTFSLKKISKAMFDTTIVRIKSVGSYSYNYTFNFQYSFVTANSLSFSYTMKGVYDAPNLSSADSANAAWTVSGILPAATQYKVNGLYIRDGSEASKVRNKNSLNTKLELTLKDISASKETGKILGGTADGSLNGSDTNGDTFSYIVNVVFNGDQTATITVNEQTYNVNLTKGQVDPQ